MFFSHRLKTHSQDMFPRKRQRATSRGREVAELERHVGDVEGFLAAGLQNSSQLEELAEREAGGSGSTERKRGLALYPLFYCYYDYYYLLLLLLLLLLFTHLCVIYLFLPGGVLGFWGGGSRHLTGAVFLLVEDEGSELVVQAAQWIPGLRAVGRQDCPEPMV